MNSTNELPQCRISIERITGEKIEQTANRELNQRHTGLKDVMDTGRGAGKETELLVELLDRFTFGLTYDQVVEQFAEAVYQLVPCAVCSIYLFDTRNNRLVRMCSNSENSISIADGSNWVDMRRELQTITKPVFISGCLDAKKTDSFQTFSFRESCLIVPVRGHGTCQGFLTLDYYQQSAIDETIVRLVQSLANAAGITLVNARLSEKSNEHFKRVRAIDKIDQAISGSLDLNEILDVFLKEVVSLLRVDAAAVLLLNSETQDLEFVAGNGFRTNALRFTRLRLGQSHAGSAASEGRMIYIADLNKQETGFRLSPEIGHEGFITYYGVPLISKAEVVGVLEIFHRTHLAFDQDRLEFLPTLAGQAAIAIETAAMFVNLQRSNREVSRAYEKTLEGWGRALEYRDRETKGHGQRVVDWTMKIAEKMGIGDAERVHIRRGALLHDIGKMGIPDSILLKPGPLSDEEWVIMRQHPAYAYDMLQGIDYLRPALDIPYSHHERWDGSGYPLGQKGTEIPLAARIFAVVDVYDALTSDRPYKDAWSISKTLEHIKDQAGKHFDPQVVDVFLMLFDSNSK